MKKTSESAITIPGQRCRCTPSRSSVRVSSATDSARRGALQGSTATTAITAASADGNGRERCPLRDVDPRWPSSNSAHRPVDEHRQRHDEENPTAALQNANAGQRHLPSGIVFGGRAAPLADARTRRRERSSSTSSTAANATSTSAMTRCRRSVEERAVLQVDRPGQCVVPHERHRAEVRQRVEPDEERCRTE